MDNVENLQSTPAPQTEPVDLQAQIDSLHYLINRVLVLLIVVSGTLGIFLLRQYKYTKQELDAVRPRALEFIADYQKGLGPQADMFIKKLADFGGTNSDFLPIIAKYGIKPTGTRGVSPISPAGVTNRK